ncbi:MAG TPA: hypothetical protein VGJ71_10150, partial [Candidatus Limnocylindrales bacterium]
MTIRSGGRARERSQARPADPGTYEEPWQPEYVQETGRGGGRDGGGRNGGGGHNGGYNGWNTNRRRGLPGLVKFLLFALVLGGIVVLLLVTALRPLIRSAVVGWAADSPAALGVPFVADLVKEDLGAKLTDPASTDATQVAFEVKNGESASEIAAR